MRRWLRNTAILVLLAIAAVAVVRLAEPWLMEMPAEAGDGAGE